MKSAVWNISYAMLVLGAVLFGVSGIMPHAVLAAKGNLMAAKTYQSRTAAPLHVTLGKAELVDLPRAVTDVLVANPDRVDVTAVQSDRLYVVGLSVGDTNIITLDAQGNVVKQIDVHVRYDLQAIQSLLEGLFPDENPQVAAVHDQILLTGTVSTPEKANKITHLVAHYVSDLQDEDGTIDELVANMMDVRGEQQVTLQVKIVEASRTILKELGLETNLNDTNELSTTTLFGANPRNSITSRGDSLSFGTGAGIGLSEDPTGSLALLAETGLRGIGQVGLFLNALEEENLVNILAEPNLTAVSGEQAGFLAGGEFPVPVGRDNVGNIVIDFREFGVSLDFRPTVLSKERISLQMDTEVSSLDNENAIVLADLTVPGLDIRRAETTVEIPSGGSLMIAGLLQSEAVKGMAGLPGIRSTPILGDLVSSDSFRRAETELLVIVTPYLVEPFSDRPEVRVKEVGASHPLARMFAQNIRENFDIKDEDVILAQEARFGYLLD